METRMRAPRPGRWLTVGLGLLTMAMGGVLILRPFRSLSVLVLVVGLALAVTGVVEAVRAARSTTTSPAGWLVGVGALVAAVVVMAWPDLTLWGLAVVVGLHLIGSGIVEVVAAVRGGGERAASLLSGAAGIVFGGLALAWPAVTVLVLAIVVGARTVLAGGTLVAGSLRSPSDGGTGVAPPSAADPGRGRFGRSLRLVGSLLSLVLAMVLAAVSVVIHRAEPDAPGAFYVPEPASLARAAPGTILRSEPMPSFDPSSSAFRVLYASTGLDGEPVAVSGVVYVPNGPIPPGGRPIVAVNHGTTGVASNCAPSLVVDQTKTPVFAFGAPSLLAAGFVVAATDYRGLGTAGPHPYLIGEAAGRDALDAVRAAHNLPDTGAGTDFAVWGHSQGGQASMFTGQLAADYAPELHLVGVAAGAPVSDLEAVLKQNVDSALGRVLVSFALSAWSETYGVSLDRLVTRVAAPLIDRVARRCLNSVNVLEAFPEAVAMGSGFLIRNPWDVEPFAGFITDNNPGQTPIDSPVLITGGDADTIVPPDATRALATRQCGYGQPVELYLMPGVSHPAGGREAAAHVAAWIADRFAGRPAASSCPPTG